MNAVPDGQSPLNVLVTGIGGPTPRNIVYALRKYGRTGPYRIVGTDANPLSHALYDDTVVDSAYVVPRCDSEDYWSSIIAIVQRERIDVAIVQSEVEVECWGDRMSHGLPCPSLVPDPRLTRVFRNKARVAEILQGSEFVPNSITVQQGSTPIDLGEQLG